MDWIWRWTNKQSEKRHHRFKRRRNIIAKSLQDMIFRQRIVPDGKKELKRLKRHEILKEYDE